MSGNAIDIGTMLRALRKEKGLSIFKVAKELNISGNYLSQIERDIKVPSEVVIYRIAKFYELDPEELLFKFGKTMPAWTKDVIDIPHLKKIVTEISNDKRIENDQKERIAKELYQIYNDHLKEDD